MLYWVKTKKYLENFLLFKCPRQCCKFFININFLIFSLKGLFISLKMLKNSLYLLFLNKFKWVIILIEGGVLI